MEIEKKKGKERGEPISVFSLTLGGKGDEIG